MKMTVTEQKVLWEQDAIDPGWFIADAIGSIRSSASYRPGGWWFLPAWLPDIDHHDVGPFRSKAIAFNEAERLAREQHCHS